MVPAVAVVHTAQVQSLELQVELKQERAVPLAQQEGLLLLIVEVVAVAVQLLQQVVPEDRDY
jgi:hypothetical protein